SFFATHNVTTEPICDSARYTGVDTLDQWAAVAADCSFGWELGPGDVDGLHAYRDFGTALLEAGYPHDCLTMLATLITPYAGGLGSMSLTPEQEQAAVEVLAVGEKCWQAFDSKMEMLAAPKCPSDTDCFALENPHGAACPVLTHDGRPLTATDGPLADNSFCC